MPRKRAAGTVTLHEVARLAGVSVATASRAINGSTSREVGEPLRVRVQEAADLLGYAPDANAQAMATGATRTVGVTVHDLSDPYFAAMAGGMVTAGEQRDLFLVLASTGNRADRLPGVIRELDSLRVRAIVVAGGTWHDPVVSAELAAAIGRYRRRSGRVASVGVEIAGVDRVHVDDAGGARALAEQLWNLGYRRPIVLAGPAQHSTARERSRAFATRYAELGAPVADGHLVECAFTRDGGLAAMADALDAGLDADVVVASNDVMALGAMAQARRRGVDIPGELAFAGFGDIPGALDAVPSLTTVEVPLAEIGEAAVQLAIEGPGDGTGLTRIATRLVIRDSTPPRSSGPA